MVRRHQYRRHHSHPECHCTATYTVTVTLANGCSDTESIIITQDENVPTAGIGIPTTTILTCSVTSINLTATGGGSYSWSDGTNIVGTTATLNVTAPATYTVTVTSANGCSDTESIVITQDIAAPTAGITPPTTTILTCSVTSINLTATGGVSYSWSDGTNIVGTTATLNVTAPATYTVTVTLANGCSDTESIVITQDIAVPTAGITPPTTTILTCSVTSINLTATGGGSYSWSDGTNIVGTTATLNVTAPGTYTVTVTLANGCSDTESIVITQDIAVPTAGITPPSTTVLTCSVTSINLTATGGGSYSWSDGTNIVGTTATLNVTAPGTYTVTVTLANGCSDTESIVITQDIAVPTAGITPPTTTILTCSVTSINLTATGGGSYSWSDGTNIVGTTATLNVTAPATYTVTVTLANGCSDTESITITQDIAAPTAGITPPSTTVLTCSVTSINLTATGGGSYSWSDGTNIVGTTATLNVTAPGTYTVTVTLANGCSDTESIAITQDIAVPTAGITPPSTTILSCSVTSINLTATGGGSYSWSDGTNIVGTTATLNVTAPGTYTVTVTLANGCSDTESIVITQDIAVPTAGITPPTTTILTCSVTSINLTATGGGSYSWSDGTNIVGTTATLNVTHSHAECDRTCYLYGNRYAGQWMF
ncbi:MAG: hypothetical protein IPH20_23105 [Bacteroidales bacterium]|nr:hypothetical protein [Bacteroidales bacterium]